MSKKITLQNFLKMSPDIPQYTDANQHYLLSGVNPTYYNDGVGTQEEQIAPLIASCKWLDLLGASLTAVDLTISTDSTYSAFAMFSTSEVYGIDMGSASSSGCGFRTS